MQLIKYSNENERQNKTDNGFFLLRLLAIASIPVVCFGSEEKE
jgi:hypothetical protein